MPALFQCLWFFPLAQLTLLRGTLSHPPVPASVSCASRVSAEALGAPLLTRAWKKDWRASRAEPVAGEAARESRAGLEAEAHDSWEDYDWGRPTGGACCCQAVQGVQRAHLAAGAT
jgi:hypothetical protein